MATKLPQDQVDEINQSLQPLKPAPKGNGAVVVDRGDYTVITIKNPGALYLKKDKPGDGIDYFPGDEIVTNGPLFGPDKNPVGGYIQNGVVKKDFVDPRHGEGNFADMNGVIGQKKNGQFFLLTYYEWLIKEFPDGEVSWAFQNGPIVVKDDSGPLHLADINKRNILRTAIGYNKEGNLLIISTKAPTNMYTVGEYLKNEGAIGGMYLDGDNVGYIDNGQMHGHIIDGSTTLHIQRKPGRKR